ncbi:MAG: autotransporter domain-containing protein [Pseudomonadota bacterium]
MPKKSHRFSAFCCLLFITNSARAVTLTSGQTDYTTPSDITTSASGIISSLVGTSSSFNKITNSFTITTGNSGATSSAYGIRSSGNYNQITNSSGATILTTGSSGRGISVGNFSDVINAGNISTQGTTSYGIYLGGNSNSANNSGIISTVNSTSYGIYLNGDNNSVTNSGSITTSQTYGIYVSAGSGSGASSTNFSTVNNSGTITSNSHGIYAKDNYTQITNSGAITPESSTSIYGIITEGDNSAITNSGTITATKYAIYNSGANSIINNSGTLNGGIHLGGGTLNIYGGSISGEVVGDLGNVNIAADFNQTSVFSDLTNLTVTSGATLNSENEIEVATVFLDANSTLTLSDGSSVSAAIQGLSDSNGTLNISGIDFTSTNSLGISGNSLANLNINSGSSLTYSDNIYADNILVGGDFDFSATDNLEIFGSLSGSGSGVINIGSNNQIISGDFSLLSGDTLSVTLKENAVGNFTVLGAANIDSNSNLEITTSADQGYIADGTQLTIISAGSGSINAINDANISVNGASSNIYGLLKFTTQSSANNLILNIDRLAASEVTSNKNSQNIYQNLNEIGVDSTGQLLAFQEYLGSSDEITKSLNQLAPQSSKAMIANNINLATNSIKTAETRLRKIHANTDLKSGIWTQAFGNSATQNAIEDDEGYKVNTIGLSVGADRELSNSSTIGAALSYARSNLKSLDSSKNNVIDTYQINFYSGCNFNKYFFDSLAGIAWNQYNSNRSITAVDANATAKFNGQTYIAKTKAGFSQKLKHGFNFGPEVAMSFVRTNIQGYSEKGADSLNLSVKNISANFLEGRIGTNLGFVTTKIPEFPELNKVDSLLKISYGYSFINDAPVTVSSFDGQTTNFTTQIYHVDRSSLKLGAEIEAHHVEDIIFSLEYGFEKRATFQSHYMAAKVKQMF